MSIGRHGAPAVAAARCLVAALGPVAVLRASAATAAAAKTSPPMFSKKSRLGGKNGRLDNHGDLWGRVSNLTPYTRTLVKNCSGCSGAHH